MNGNEKTSRFTRKARVLALLILSILGLSPEAQAQFREIISDSSSLIQRQALLDARAYIAKVEGEVPEIKKSKDWSKGSAIIIGIASENPLLKVYAEKAAQLKNDGFIIDRAKMGSVSCIVVTAASDEGVANGIYELLRQLGFGFSLGSEFAPDKLNARDVSPKTQSYALRLYGRENLTETSAIHEALDMLPDRWVNGSGQGECTNFTWGTLGTEQELQALLDIQKKAEQIQFKNPYAKANWQWLKDRIYWVLNYRAMTQKPCLPKSL